jgi:hypothetical protein
MTDQTPSPDLNADEKAELERLRVEVAELEQQVKPPKPKRAGRWRTLAATLLIIFGAIFVPAAIMGAWTKSQITDTNRYVQTIAPLANNQAIQDSVANTITEEIFKYVDVKSLTEQVFSKLGSKGILPDFLVQQLQSLAGPVSAGIENFIRSAVNKIVHSGAFASAWIDANKIAHQSLVDALSGNTNGNVTVADGKVSVNMAALIDTVKTSLSSRGFSFADKIPSVNASFTILESKNLATAQKIYKVLNPLAYVLLFLAVGFLIAGIFVAKSRRRATIGAGIAIFVAAGVTAIGLALVRTGYLNAVPSSVLSQSAAASIFDTLFRFVKDGIRNTALIGLIVAIGAFLLGSASGVVAVRRWCVQGIAAVRNGVEKLGVHLAVISDWLGPKARIFRGLTVVGGIIWFALWKYRTPTDVLWIVFGMLVALAIIQFFATPAPKQTASPSDSSGLVAA